MEPPPPPVEPKAKVGAKLPRTKTAFEVSLATANTAKKAFLYAREKSEHLLENIATGPTYVKEKDSYEIELTWLAIEMKDAQKKCVFTLAFV